MVNSLDDSLAQAVRRLETTGEVTVKRMTHGSPYHERRTSIMSTLSESFDERRGVFRHQANMVLFSS